MTARRRTRQHRTQRRHVAARAGLAAVLGAALLGSAACTSEHDDHGSASASPSATASRTTTAPGADAVSRAKVQAAQYDYDGAVATLTKAGGDAAKAELAQVQAARAKAVRWPDDATIPHVFYHSLAVDPKRAFTKDSTGTGFSQYMATVSEFRKELQSMYDRGWVLVHPERIAAKGPKGAMTYQPIMLPPGKKPFVLSLDDLSYYEYMTGHGFANVLIKKPDGRIVNTYTDASGKTVEGDFDCVPILDDFVRAHPDFSYRGDKGSIALTGYNGVLGYRTSVHKYGDTPATKQAQAKAKVVADAIKAEGWHFASHSWGHINFTRTGVGGIKADAKRWDAEVRPIVGDTPEMIFPFGADISDVKQYSMANPKFAFLHGVEKFDYFFNVDASQDHWMQITPDSLRQARIDIDGITMQRALDGKKTALAQFFDVKAVVDPERPLPVPSVGGPVAGGA